MNNPSYFTDLVTLFNNSSDRTVASLSKLYEDYEGLYKVIKSLFDQRVMSEKIQAKRILLKPNWVLHNRTETDEICLRTHDEFLLAGLEVVLSNNPISVMIADAPVQGCKWDQVVRPNFIEKVQSLEAKYNVPIVIKDFRRVTFDPGSNNLTIERNPIEDYIIFDLGKKSFLEPITSSKKSLFRVTDYDPDRLAESHKPGTHKYCISRDVFDADIVITFPKVKTHQKAGVTNAIKILVGINGDKDYLPHHRKGGSKNGGDCYPESNLLLNLAENILDSANRLRGTKYYKPLRYLSILFWKLSMPSPKHNLAAAWHGNDTTWRMTLDLNRIAEYGDANGSISNKVRREIYSLSDGIIGGQGDGPLNPIPLPLGIIGFSNCSSLTDAVMAKLMGFEIKKLSIVNEALKMDEQKLKQLKLNGKEIELSDLINLSIKTIPPPGWVDYL
jgi:uncharacterized protein (DUF362 family)